MEFVKKHWKDILLVLFGIVCIALLMSTTCTSQRNHELETNIRALNDSVKTYQLKNGELMYEKQGYILKVEELEQYIGVQEKEVKDIERRLKSALATISRLEGQIHADSITMHDSVYVTPDSTVHIYFDYADDWLALDGVTSYGLRTGLASTTLDCMHMQLPLKVGMAEDNQWFATTPNPYVTFTTVEGANLQQAKPKRWCLSIQAGVGGLLGWGISGGQDGIVRSGWILGGGFYVGAGVSYKLYEF